MSMKFVDHELFCDKMFSGPSIFVCKTWSHWLFLDPNHMLAFCAPKNAKGVLDDETFDMKQGVLQDI